MATKTALPDEGSRSAVARMLSPSSCHPPLLLRYYLQRTRQLWTFSSKKTVEFQASGMAPPSHSYRVSPLIQNLKNVPALDLLSCFTGLLALQSMATWPSVGLGSVGVSAVMHQLGLRYVLFLLNPFSYVVADSNPQTNL